MRLFISDTDLEVAAETVRQQNEEHCNDPAGPGVSARIGKEVMPLVMRALAAELNRETEPAALMHGVARMVVLILSTSGRLTMSPALSDDARDKIMRDLCASIAEEVIAIFRGKSHPPGVSVPIKSTVGSVQ